jgi:hypothetical protein
VEALANFIRASVRDDPELLDLQEQVRRRRLRIASGLLPRVIIPSDFTQAAVTCLGERTSAPQWTGVVDPWVVWLRQGIRRRVAEILTETFDQLRDHRLEATGRAVATPISIIALPSDLWSSTATLVETATGDVLIGGVRAFVDVIIAPPMAQLRGVSRAKLDTFASAFDGAMQAAGRRYALGELVTAARQALGAGISAREVDSTLRRSSPAAWAGSGRRRACVVPTVDEIAQAARQAAESGA